MFVPLSLLAGFLGGIGLPELIFILLICLVIFGPKALPQLGKSLGRGLREFKDATSRMTDAIEQEADEDWKKGRPAGSPAVPPVTTPATAVVASSTGSPAPDQQPKA